jgi:hypothetical protein
MLHIDPRNEKSRDGSAYARFGICRLKSKKLCTRRPVQPTNAAGPSARDLSRFQLSAAEAGSVDSENAEER